ncbi:MAG: hypothetical protein F6K41_11680 [Symploca sp. SIO3E6]|nr:hypothetical protein [Caldora sp. SIO3E6]
MEKVKIIKLLLVLAFVPSLLVGCQSLGTTTKEPGNQISNLNPKTDKITALATLQSPDSSTLLVASDEEFIKLYEQVESLKQENNQLKTEVKELSNKLQQLIERFLLLFMVVIMVITIRFVARLLIDYQVIGQSIVRLINGIGKLINGIGRLINCIGRLINNLFHKLINSKSDEENSHSSQENSVNSARSSYLTNKDTDELFKDLHDQLWHELSAQFITPGQLTSIVTRLQRLEHALRVNYQNHLSSQQKQLPYQKPLSSQQVQVPEVPYQQPPIQKPTKNLPANLSAAQLVVRDYNTNPASLQPKATIVSETGESIEQRRLGRNLAPILEKNRGGNYWILNSGNSSYLVPDIDITINEYNYGTLKSLFECSISEPEDFSNWQLIKPAEVVPIASGKQWQLSKLGIIQFT